MLLQLLDFSLVLLSIGAVFIIPGYTLLQMRAVMQSKGYVPHVAHLYLTVAGVAGVIVAGFAINFAWGFQTYLGGIDFVLCTVLPTTVVCLALFAITKLLPQQEGRKGGFRKTIDHQFWGRLCLGLIGVVVVGGVLAFATEIIDLKDKNTGGMKIGIWSLIIFGLYKYSQHLMRNVYRETVPTFEDKVETDPRPPVIYLRSFAEETLPFAGVPFEKYTSYCSAPHWISSSPGIGSGVLLTFEEFFVRSFEYEIGPLVALGSPEDYVMPEGAARHYADDDDWKDKFLELIGKASCIVTMVSNSNNLEWEYRQILQHRLQDKFFVFTRCFEQSRSIFAKTKDTILSTLGVREQLDTLYGKWQQFSGVLKQAGFSVEVPLPEQPTVLGFNKEGTMIVLHSIAVNGGANPLAYVLTVKERLSQAPKRSRKNKLGSLHPRRENN